MVRGVPDSWLWHEAFSSTHDNYRLGLWDHPQMAPNASLPCSLLGSKEFLWPFSILPEPDGLSVPGLWHGLLYLYSHMGIVPIPPKLCAKLVASP